MIDYVCLSVIMWVIKLHTQLKIKIIPAHLQGVQKKGGLANAAVFALLLNIELLSFLIHLKIEIYLFIPSTEPLLSDFREPRNRFFRQAEA